jgi:hypothetical protein
MLRLTPKAVARSRCSLKFTVHSQGASRGSQWSHEGIAPVTTASGDLIWSRNTLSNDALCHKVDW